MLPRAILSCLLAMALLQIASACGGKTKESQLVNTVVSSEKESEPGRLPDQALPPEFTQQSPAFRNSRALQYLPETLLALMITHSPAELSSTLESTAILREYPTIYSDIEKLRATNGAMLFLPGTWAQAGIGATSKAGIALEVQNRKLIVYFFVTVKDKKKLRETLLSLGGGGSPGISMIGEDGNGYYVTWPQLPKLAVVVRDKIAFLVVAEKSDALKSSLRKMVALSSEQSVATKFTKENYEGFDFGEKLAGFISFDEIAKAAGDDVDRDDYILEQIEGLERQISAAQDEGRTKDADSLKADLQHQLKWHKKSQLSEAGHLLAIKHYLKPLGLSPIGIASKGSSTRFRMQLNPKAESVIASLFTANTAPLALPSRLQGRPVFMVSGHFNIPELLTMMRPILFFEGTTPERIRSTVQENLGVTLNELSNHFDGEISAAFSVDLAPKSTILDASWGIHFLAHLSDPKKAQALLTQIGKKQKFKQYVTVVNGVPVLDIPSPFETGKVRIRIDGEFLEARTLREFSAKPDWTDEEIALLTASASRGIVVMDPSLFALTFMAGSYSNSLDENRSLSENQAKRLATLRKTEQRFQRELRHAVRKRIAHSSKRFGRFVVTAQNRKKGYALLGGLHNGSPNLGRGIQAMIESIAPRWEKSRVGNIPKVILLRNRIDDIRRQIGQFSGPVFE